MRALQRRLQKLGIARPGKCILPPLLACTPLEVPTCWHFASPLA